MDAFGRPDSTRTREPGEGGKMCVLNTAVCWPRAAPIKFGCTAVLTDGAKQRTSICRKQLRIVLAVTQK